LNIVMTLAIVCSLAAPAFSQAHGGDNAKEEIQRRRRSNKQASKTVALEPAMSCHSLQAHFCRNFGADGLALEIKEATLQRRLKEGTAPGQPGRVGAFLAT
jgi:hypothetical protein